VVSQDTLIPRKSTVGSANRQQEGLVCSWFRRARWLGWLLIRECL